MYGEVALPQLLSPEPAKSVGKVCAAPESSLKLRLAEVAPLLVYCVLTAVIGFGPTVVSLLPTHRKTFCRATLDSASLDVPLQLFRSACIVLSWLLLIVALYMQAV